MTGASTQMAPNCMGRPPTVEDKTNEGAIVFSRKISPTTTTTTTPPEDDGVATCECNLQVVVVVSLAACLLAGSCHSPVGPKLGRACLC